MVFLSPFWLIYDDNLENEFDQNLVQIHFCPFSGSRPFDSTSRTWPCYKLEHCFSLAFGFFLMFVLDFFTRLQIGLEQHTRIVVTWTSTLARSELAEPSMPTTTRRTRAPSSWWTPPGPWEACTAEAASSGVADSSVPVEVLAGGTLTWTWRTPDHFKFWARHRRTKKGLFNFNSRHRYFKYDDKNFRMSLV